MSEAVIERMGLAMMTVPGCGGLRVRDYYAMARAAFDAMPEDARLAFEKRIASEMRLYRVGLDLVEVDAVMKEPPNAA